MGLKDLGIQAVTLCAGFSFHGGLSGDLRLSLRTPSNHGNVHGRRKKNYKRTRGAVGRGGLTTGNGLPQHMRWATWRGLPKPHNP